MTAKIPEKNFARRIYCFEKCRALTPHILFHVGETDHNGKKYYQYHRKCTICGHAEYDELIEASYEALILNKYL